MITVENLSYSFPQKDLYNNISFTIEAGRHCAFIGVSGSGKSTLMDLLMNPEKHMYDGKLELEAQPEIGYVSQFFREDESREVTVFEYIGGRCIKLQNEIDAICAEMETAADTELLMEKYQEALESFEALGGHEFESQINKKLNLADLIKCKNMKVSELSGGEFKLVQVVREMMNSPELIIMDEPDVFLDFENINSLKNLINEHRGTLVVITHSRYLLNHCFDKIIHLENLELQEFDGSFIDYNFSLLARKIELQELAAADSEEITRNDMLINKMRKLATECSEPSKGKSLKARVKVQERLEARKIKEPFVYIKRPNIQFEAVETAEEATALTVTNYGVSFDEVLLENVSFEIKATDKVALIGPNGSGKTTLLRGIFENSKPSIELGENIKMAYLSQVQGEMLNEANTIFEEFYDAGIRTRDEAASAISGYGFELEALDQKIASLSGGEKNMLQLAKISGGRANLLLLDEPTSQLDTYSQIALEKALEDYKGAILMVSHDFYSIVNCMDFALIIDGGTIRKITMRKFRKMIYAKHFSVGYLELEQKKKTLETKIEAALQSKDFELAKTLLQDLEALIEQLQIKK